MNTARWLSTKSSISRVGDFRGQHVRSFTRSGHHRIEESAPHVIIFILYYCGLARRDINWIEILRLPLYHDLGFRREEGVEAWCIIASGSDLESGGHNYWVIWAMAGSVRRLRLPLFFFLVYPHHPSPCHMPLPRRRHKTRG